MLAILRSEDEPLVVISRELQLSKAELGELFGVSRQAVSEWVDKGIPSGRMRDVSQVEGRINPVSQAEARTNQLGGSPAGVGAGGANPHRSHA